MKNIPDWKANYSYLNCIETGVEYGFGVNALGQIYSSNVGFPNELISYLNDLCYKYNFNVPSHDLIKDIFTLSVEYVDYFNPYFLLELANIKKSEDKYYYQFKLNLDSIRFLNPNEFDTFLTKEFNYEELYTAYMNPWFSSRTMINEYDDIDSPEFYLLEERLPSINEITYKYNLSDVKIIELLFNSILIWMISPSEEAIKWRNEYLEIFDSCHKYSEGLLFFDMNVLNPSEYVKLNIPTQVCVICNQRLPCSKLVKYEDNIVYYCNNHINMYENNITIYDNEISYDYDGECQYNCDNCQISSCLFSKNKLLIRSFEKESYRFMIARQVIKKNPDLKSKLKLSSTLSILRNNKLLK